jgi:uncharacterized protein (TIGR02270 family)
MPIVANVISQHAEDAAFLWLLRSRAVVAPSYRLRDLAILDNRISAHLDGLAIAGRAAWDVCRAELDWGEPGEAFAVAHLAMSQGEVAGVAQIVEPAAENPGMAAGIISAFGWQEFDHVRSMAETLMKSEDPTARRIGIGAFAVHRHDPGLHLLRAFSAPDDLLRARALKAAGELGRIDLAPDVRVHLADHDLACRSTAAVAAALLGLRTPDVLARLDEASRSAGLSHQKRQTATLVFLRVLSEDEGVRWFETAQNEPGLARRAALGAGAVGDPRLLPALLNLLTVPRAARAAGDSIAMITGVDLEQEDLTEDPPVDFTFGPTEDPDDDNVEMDEDDDRPWPDRMRLIEWCRANGGRFLVGSRHILGRSLKGFEKAAELHSGHPIRAALTVGSQWQRIAAGFEHALRNAASPLEETRTRGDWQMRRWTIGS